MVLILKYFVKITKLSFFSLFRSLKHIFSMTENQIISFTRITAIYLSKLSRPRKNSSFFKLEKAACAPKRKLITSSV